MPVRTNATAVGKIIKVRASDDLTPFIEVASALVDEHCATKTDSEGVALYDAARLELIERWLAAHSYGAWKPPTDSEHAGSVSQRFQYKIDLGFDRTFHGQMAMRLDAAGGGLIAINAAAKAKRSATVSATWGGTEIADVPDDWVNSGT